MNDVFIREQKLPKTVNGLTVEDCEGDYNVYLNSYLSNEAKHKSLIHELLHIKRCDFCGSDVGEIEKLT